MPTALLLSLLSPAFAGSPDDLVSAYATPDATVDYVFLLDTAGPQKALAEAARADVAAFVEKVPAGDTVAVVAFHTRPSVVLEPKKVDDAGRAALVEKIRTLELPTAKEEDVAAGLAQAGALLGRNGASPAQFLFVVSNFCHNPPVTSEWANAGQGCRQLRGADTLAGKLKAGPGHSLTSWAFPVSANAAPPQTGVDAALGVLREAGSVELAATPFSAWIGDFGQRLPLERVRPLAHMEAARATLGATVVKGPTGDDPTATLRLSSGLEHLRMRLDDVVIDGAKPGSWPTTIELSPGADVPVEITVAAPPWSLFPRHEKLDVPLTLHAHGTLLPDEGLAAVDVGTDRPDLSVPVRLTFERHYGLSGTTAGGILLATFGVGGFMAVWVRGRFLPRRLGGSFGYRRGDGPRIHLDIASLGEAPIVIAADGNLSIGAEKDAVLVLRMVRPIWSAHAEVEIRPKREVEINRKPVPPGRHRVVAGATSFQFGEYRLTWE